MFLLYRKEIIFWHLAHKVTCAINRGELVKPCLPRKHVGRLVTNYNYVSLPVAALQYLRCCLWFYFRNISILHLLEPTTQCHISLNRLY